MMSIVIFLNPFIECLKILESGLSYFLKNFMDDMHIDVSFDNIQNDVAFSSCRLQFSIIEL